jgi:membrane-associated protein
MELLAWFWDLALHLDVHLAAFVAEHGVWVYGLLFLIVFCETGLVVTTFLPGDSLLFVTGAVAAAGGMDIVLVMAALVAAALCGDNVNYWIGRTLGLRVFSRFINPAHLKRTHEFYERHGGKTIIIARFVPIIRTFAPAVAGVGKMSYRRFISFNVFGGIAWSLSMTLLGFTLGKQFPQITKRIDMVIIVIILISVMPIVISYLKNRNKSVPPAVAA